MQPGAFEPWSTRAKELVSIDPKSPAYQRAAKIVTAAAADGSDDPTGGATHFLAPRLMAARGTALPNWAQGSSVTIGDQRFFKPGDPNYGDGGLAAINAAIGASSSQPPTALGYTDEPKSAAPVTLFKSAGFNVPGKAPASLFKDAGFDVPGATTGPSQGAGAAAPPVGSIFKDAGFALPGNKAAVPTANSNQFSDEIAIPVPGSPEYAAQTATANSTPPSLENVDTLEGAAEAIRKGTDPVTVAKSLRNDAWDSIAKNYRGSKVLAAGGIQDIKNRDFLPSFPSSDPQTWTAGGLLKTGVGALGTVMSPATGSVDALVTNPVTQLTGNPDIGNRAGFVANALLGGPKAASVLKNALPENKAMNALVDAIGPENVPSAVARMSANPRLSLMDVSDPVRTLAQGLIDPAQPKAQMLISDAARARAAEAPAAVNAAYTAAMGPAPDVVSMVDALKQRAREAGRQAIEPAVANAKPVDVSPVIDAIDKTVKPGMAALADPGTRLPLSDLQQELVRFKSQLTDGSSVVTDATNCTACSPTWETWPISSRAARTRRIVC